MAGAVGFPTPLETFTPPTILSVRATGCISRHALGPFRTRFIGARPSRPARLLHSTHPKTHSRRSPLLEGRRRPVYNPRKRSWRARDHRGKERADHDCETETAAPA